MHTVFRAPLWLACSVSLLAATACSGPTINAFKLTAGPSTLTIAAGGTTNIGVSATTTASAPITATIILYDLPPGISYSPSSPVITTGGQTIITLTAVPNAPPVTKQIEVTGYAGLAGSSSSIMLTVAPSQ